MLTPAFYVFFHKKIVRRQYNNIERRKMSKGYRSNACDDKMVFQSTLAVQRCLHSLLLQLAYVNHTLHKTFIL